jgi:hypothetical protein
VYIPLIDIELVIYLLIYLRISFIIINDSYINLLLHFHDSSPRPAPYQSNSHNSNQPIWHQISGVGTILPRGNTQNGLTGRIQRLYSGFCGVRCGFRASGHGGLENRALGVWVMDAWAGLACVMDG